MQKASHHVIQSAKKRTIPSNMIIVIYKNAVNILEYGVQCQLDVLV